MNSFQKKKIRVTLALGQDGLNFDDKNNTVIIEDMRVSATVNGGRGAVQPSAQVMIYGLSMQILNRITKIKWNTEAKKLNSIRLETSSDGGKTYSTLYYGTIIFASPNFSSSPEVILTIDSITAFNHQIQPVKPVSFKGEVDVAAVIEQICKNMGMRFENNGVTAKISNPYLPQPSLGQIAELCKAVDAQMVVDMDTVAIMLSGQPRKLQIPVISANTGLIGYPTPTIQGVDFQCLFDPFVRFNGMVEIKDSIIEMANGRWHIYGLTHYLESEVAGGKWFSQVHADQVGSGVKLAK